ncbi:MAG: multicopper oxidase domain-containing protein [Cyanobacteria bacterium P01_B01_bin.77]
MRLSMLLRRLLISALVGLFINVGTFTGRAKAATTTTSTWKDQCQLNSHVTQQLFQNPGHIDADSAAIIQSATEDTFPLDGLSDVSFNGRLYDTTSVAAAFPSPVVEHFGSLYSPPTIRVSPGKSINLDLENNLPLDADNLLPALPQTEENLESVSQDTNLHYHGFNVSPLLGSDDVVMHVHSNITPTEPGSNNTVTDGGDYPQPVSPEGFAPEPITDYQMQVNVPAGHQSGLFWYHPHVHTASDAQVRGGMSGGIIVEGMEDTYTILKGITLAKATTIGGKSYKAGDKAPITEQVMLFKDFNNKFGVADGSSLPSGVTKVNCFTLNGALNPKITIQPGEVQFWRIGNIGADQYLNIQLLDPSEPDPNAPSYNPVGSPVPLYILARDSNVVAQPVQTESVLIPPASRVELLVVGGETGKNYNLVSVPTPVVSGAVKRRSIDYQLATSKISGSEVDYNTSGKTVGEYILAQKPTKIDDILPTPEAISGFSDCHNGSDHSKCIAESRSFTFNSAKLTHSPNPSVVFTINDELYDENRIDTVAKLGDIEEWTLVNSGGGQHAYHMHQLDFVVTGITAPTDDFETITLLERGVPHTIPISYDNYIVKDCSLSSDGDNYTCAVEPQGFRDMINLPPNSSTVIRIPFLNPFITGVFVYHCHILAHEDRGMMQNVKVVDPKTYQPTAANALLLKKAR